MVKNREGNMEYYLDHNTGQVVTKQTRHTRSLKLFAGLTFGHLKRQAQKYTRKPKTTSTKEL